MLPLASFFTRRHAMLSSTYEPIAFLRNCVATSGCDRLDDGPDTTEGSAPGLPGSAVLPELLRDAELGSLLA